MKRHKLWRTSVSSFLKLSPKPKGNKYLHKPGSEQSCWGTHCHVWQATEIPSIDTDFCVWNKGSLEQKRNLRIRNYPFSKQRKWCAKNHPPDKLIFLWQKSKEKNWINSVIKNVIFEVMQRIETFNYLPCLFPPSSEMSTLPCLNSPPHHSNPSPLQWHFHQDLLLTENIFNISSFLYCRTVHVSNLL